MTIEQQVMLYLMIAGTALSALLALGCGYLVFKHPAHPFRRRLVFVSVFAFVNAVFVGLGYNQIMVSLRTLKHQGRSCLPNSNGQGGLMKCMVAAMLALPTFGWCDEIILKDGKAISWKSITVKEDGYEVVTEAGETLNLKKDQIAKILTGPAKPEAPLTGASFTFKKSKPINLLPLIDVKTDGLSEGWSMNNSGLVATGNYLRMTKLQLSKLKDIPQEYDLTVTVERPDDRTTDFTIVLPGYTGKQFVVSFDADVGAFSGLASINGKGVAQGPAKVPGVFLKKGTTKTINIMVRQEGVIVMVDGKDFLAWKAEWDTISVPNNQVLADPKTIGFMLYHYGSYKISRMVLTTGPK